VRLVRLVRCNVSTDWPGIFVRQWLRIRRVDVPQAHWLRIWAGNFYLFNAKWLRTRRSCLGTTGTTDTTGMSRSSRYSGHDQRVGYICYYETRPFLLLVHKRPSPFFYTYPHKKPSFTLINDFVVDQLEKRISAVVQ